jgi:hypothetical protein
MPLTSLSVWVPAELSPEAHFSPHIFGAGKLHVLGGYFLGHFPAISGWAQTGLWGAKASRSLPRRAACCPPRPAKQPSEFRAAAPCFGFGENPLG